MDDAMTTDGPNDLDMLGGLNADLAALVAEGAIGADEAADMIEWLGLPFGA